jgi:hypothetical protein
MAGILDAKQYDYNLRAGDNIDAPVLLSQNFGLSGSSEYDYVAVFVTLVGKTTPSDILAVKDANANLGPVNFIRLHCSAVPPAARVIEFYKKFTDGKYRFLGSCDADVNVFDDMGQDYSQGVEPPTVNNSGRPEWRAMLWNKGKVYQRPDAMDQQWLHQRDVRNLGDTIHKNGDIIKGLKPVLYDTLRYRFPEGQIYIEGQYCTVPEAIITLQGTGEETVGVIVTPIPVTYEDDDIIRNVDEISDRRFKQTGADRLIYRFTWGIDQPGQLVVQVFRDGAPKTETLAPERTPWEITVADRLNDLVGSCTVDDFSLDILAHPTDSSKLILSIGKGTAYPAGFKTKVPTETRLSFDKARDVRSVNNSALDVFQIPGGSVISSTVEPFNLAGLSLKLKVGKGNYHTVNFTANNMSADAVAAFVNSSINPYVSGGSPNLVKCTSGSGKVEIQGKDGNSIEIAAVTSDCYTQLGIATGVYSPVGTRIYRTNDRYIKNVSDLNYRCQVCEAVTHNGSTGIDRLAKNNVVTILGASITLADAQDGKWDYTLGVDFEKDGDSISFANMGGQKPANGVTYFVCYQYRRNAVKGTRELIRVIDAEVTKGVANGIDQLAFTNATSIIRLRDGSPVTVSGIPSDILQIVKVRRSIATGATEYVNWKFTKNSDGLGHYNQSIDWANAVINDSSSTGQPTTTSKYYVTFDMWLHSIEGDYVSADSYDQYDEIEFFLGSSWIDLRDCIDFRTKTDSLPIPGDDVVLDYDHYLPRIDKLILDDQGNFFLVRGTPALQPAIPSDQANTLSVGIVRVAPYTLDPSWASTVSLGTPVVNQAAIQAMLKRLDNLEYWKAVTDLEQEVANHPVANNSVGIFTDALTGVGKMDYGFNKNGVSHTACLDINNQWLLLPTETPVPIDLNVDDNATVNVKKVGNTLLLDYVPELFMEQPYATESVNCATDYTIESYRGTATLNPASDCFIDQQQLPAINVDFDNNLQPLVDALVDQGALQLNQTIWGNWVSSYATGAIGPYGNWIGNQVMNAGMYYRYTFTYDAYGNINGYTQISAQEAQDAAFQRMISQSGGRALTRGYNAGRGWADASGWVTQTSWRDGVQKSLIPGSTSQDIGSSVVNLAMSGRVRTTNSDGSPFLIKVDVMNLMPNQDHACSMGGIVCDFTYDPSASPSRGAVGTNSYQGHTTVKSDNYGRLTGYFQVPAGLSAGSITVSIFHYEFPDSSSATVYFNSAGYVEQSRDTTIGLPTFQYITDPLHEDRTTTIYGNYYDPLAQTFVVPNQIKYMSEVGVFFRTKHPELSIRMEIRNSVNGSPGSTIFASSVKNASDVVVSEDGTAETIFELDTVVGYAANTEYSIVLMPELNNTGYSVWTAKVGGVDVKSGVMVMAQTNDGVLFHSPNNRVWEPYTKQDLKMRLYCSNFRDNCAIVFQHISGVNAALFVAAVQEFIGAGTKVSWAYSIDNQKSWIPFTPNIDTSLGEIIQEIDLRVDVTSLGGSYQMVSPISGIVFLLHKLSADAVFVNEFFVDPLAYPNQVKCYIDLDCDGTNGNGVTSVTPVFSWNDGESWVEIPHLESDVPTLQKNPFYKYLFVTPGVATVQGVSNASPMVVTSVNHGYTENCKVVIGGVGGNIAANKTWVIKNVTNDTFELYEEDDTPSTGSGNYTDGGTIRMAEMSQLRPRLALKTTNQARTPRIMNVSFIATKV